jgi:hypothetical protein
VRFCSWLSFWGRPLPQLVSKSPLSFHAAFVSTFGRSSCGRSD